MKQSLVLWIPLSLIIVVASRFVVQPAQRTTQLPVETIPHVSSPPVIHLTAGRKFITVLPAPQFLPKRNQNIQDVYLTTDRKAGEEPQRYYLDAAGIAIGSMEAKVIIQEH
jgi:hypothetical protein